MSIFVFFVSGSVWSSYRKSCVNTVMKWLVPESSSRYINRMTNEALHKGEFYIHVNTRCPHIYHTPDSVFKCPVVLQISIIDISANQKPNTTRLDSVVLDDVSTQVFSIALNYEAVSLFLCAPQVLHTACHNVQSLV